jgi:hypothetical protein
MNGERGAMVCFNVEGGHTHSRNNEKTQSKETPYSWSGDVAKHLPQRQKQMTNALTLRGSQLPLSE